MPRIGEFVVLVDTREQKPWKFLCPCLRRKLDAGDYTLQGFEKKLAIERKGSPAELAANCGSDWKRFREALCRLSQLKHKLVVCDFTLKDVYAEEWPGKMTADAVMAKLSEIMLDLGIPVLMAGKRARSTVYALMVKYYNRNR